ncbi:MAG: amino acid-binding protein [Burkholderiales bacterium]|nr:amino acid-binding protein [Burkholderiales bacterium]
MYELKCNFVDMSQTTVDDQFSSMMIIEKPTNVTKAQIQEKIQEIFKNREFEMSVVVMDCIPGMGKIPAGEPFVVTVDGNNSRGLLLAFTRIFYEGGINIESFRSIDQSFLDPEIGQAQKYLFVFEISIPPTLDRKALHRTLIDIANERNLRVSLQHRQIFEAVHRVTIA